MNLLSRQADSAYDPVHDVFLVVGASDFGGIVGVFVDTLGRPIGQPFAIEENAFLILSTSPRVAYSADVSDGAGGRGGFLVVWDQHTTGTTKVDRVALRVVAYPGLRVTNTVAFGEDFLRGNVAVAYSTISRTFLVSLVRRTFAPGFDSSLTVYRIDTSGQKTGVLDLAMTSSTLPFAKTSVVWNSVADEFGVVAPIRTATSDYQLTLFRVGPDGGLRGQSVVATTDSELHDIAFNPETGNYLIVWSTPSLEEIGSTIRRGVTGAEVSATGSVLASGPISEVFGRDPEPSTNFFSLSYSPASRTFVLSAVYDASSVGVTELNRHGRPVSPIFLVVTGLVSEPGHLAAHGVQPAWLMPVMDLFNGRGFNPVALRVQAFRSATEDGRGDALLAPSPCGDPNADPYASAGGGQCVDGSWLATIVAPTGNLIPGGCSPRDPFASLGGGTCVNGGWLPPGILPAPSLPVPPPATGGCTTPDPFVAIGGGTCSNGGWLPPGMAPPGSIPPPTEPPPLGGCSSPDPFTVLGGGTCVNGGWLPPGFAAPPSTPVPPPVTGECTTPDPFVTIGGGVCINGGWIPKGAGG